MPKLQYRFNGAIKDIMLYDAPPSVAKNIAVRIEGKTYYAGLVPTTHAYASNLRICRDGQNYTVASDSSIQPLENFTWAEIAAIIKAGNAAKYFAVGDTKPITLGSAILDSGDDVAGTNRVHFAIYSMHSTKVCEGGWESSTLRSWLNEIFYNVLPSDLRAVITACTKYANNVEGDVTATSDKI